MIAPSDSASPSSPPRTFTIAELLTPEECGALIARVERHGFEEAPITTDRGMLMAPEIRNNTRVMLDDVDLAARLWARARDRVPAQVGARRAVGMNERLRFYRYEPGQRFRLHRDGHYERPDGERSLYTFLVYLNDGFTGGGTRIEDHVVTPVTGLAVGFLHALLHEGCTVEAGRKYVLRSDVMYRAC
jgi:predicted 2-oxoglutarate/Fe(II)-dependent dioxygenase YbiX